MQTLPSILNIRFLAVLALAFVAATASYGFAGSNTVTSKAAGDGKAAISGYTVSGSSYVLDSANPAEIDIAKFSIAETTKPSTVKLQLTTSGTWLDCTVPTTNTAAPWTYECGSATSPLNIAVADASQLRVVATE
ncbi:MAG: hypothetical protein M3P51_02805 [Chloroflexota bacterium]|nr:hypothetical protein [Chloroflexota bacterium]